MESRLFTFSAPVAWCRQGRVFVFWAWLLFALLVSASVPCGAAAVLTHRYPFDTDGRDIVGGADVTLKGVAAIQDGAVVFDGTNSAVELPPNLFTNYDSVSFELWVDDETMGPKGTSTLLYFGAANYFTFSSSINPPFGSYAVLNYSSGSPVVAQLLNCPLMPAGRTNHLVLTQESVSKTARIYLNGALISQKTNFTGSLAAVGPTTKNYLCTGPAGQANVFRGKVLEFRVYQGALSGAEVAFHQAMGPDQMDVNPGELQQVRLQMPQNVSPGAMTQPFVYGDYASLSNVNLSTQPELKLISENPPVVSLVTVSNTIFGGITMGSQGTFTPKFRSQSLGTARLRAEYQGHTGIVDVAVAGAEHATLVHRYSFSEPVAASIAHDSVGDAHGRVVGGKFSGAGEITNVNYCVVLPGGMLSGVGEISIEAWVRMGGAGGGIGLPWQRIFDMGDQDPWEGGWGKTYFMMTPYTQPDFHAKGYYFRSCITTNSNAAEVPRLDWYTNLPPLVPSHVAVTYSSLHKSFELYLNGQLISAGQAIIPLSGINDVLCMLGASLFAQDPLFSGRFDEVRIHQGLLHNQEVAASYAAGPNTLVDTSSGFQISTLPPDPLEAYRVSLRALVRLDSVPTQVFFQYGSSTNYEFATDLVDVGSGSTQTVASASISNLTSLTRYYVRAAAVRDGVTNFASKLMFATTNNIIATRASKVSVNTATLNGLVAPNGLTTTVYFLYGTDSYYRYFTSTVPITLNGGPELTAFSCDMTNLAANTVYYFQAVATNTAGTTASPVVSFRTAPPLKITGFSAAGGQARATFDARAEVGYALLSSTNLVNWMETTNATAEADGPFSLSDYGVGTDRRFYRIRSP